MHLLRQLAFQGLQKFYYGIEKKGRVQLGMHFLSQLAFKGLHKFALASNGVRYNKLSIATGMMSLSNFFLKKKKISSTYIYLIRGRCIIDSHFVLFLTSNRLQFL